MKPSKKQVPPVSIKNDICLDIIGQKTADVTSEAKHLGTAVAFTYYYEVLRPIIAINHHGHCDGTNCRSMCRTFVECNLSKYLSELDNQQNAKGKWLDLFHKNRCRIRFIIIMDSNNMEYPEMFNVIKISSFSSFRRLSVKGATTDGVKIRQLSGEEMEIPVFYCNQTGMVVVTFIIPVYSIMNRDVVAAISNTNSSQLAIEHDHIVNTLQYLLRVDEESINFNYVTFKYGKNVTKDEKFWNDIKTTILSEDEEHYDIMQGLANIQLDLNSIVIVYMLNYFHNQLKQLLLECDIKHCIIVFPSFIEKYRTKNIDMVAAQDSQQKQINSGITLQVPDGWVAFCRLLIREPPTMLNDAVFESIKQSSDESRAGNASWSLADSLQEMITNLQNAPKPTKLNLKKITILKWNNADDNAEESLLTQIKLLQ